MAVGHAVAIAPPLTRRARCVRSFNIPVFWPILLMYFIALFVLTMKRQIKHMIKYRYVPFSFGKTRYKGKEEGSGGGSKDDK